MNEALKLDGNGEPAPVVKSKVVSEVELTLQQLLSAVLQSQFGEMIPQPTPYGIEIKPMFYAGNFKGVKLTWSKPDEPMAVTVNGSEKAVTVDELTYDDVVVMALDRPVASDLPMLTVTYSSKAGDGILTKGQRVKVTPGMHFDAYDTSNA